jgi:NAD(P)-dependent dehydrogenase (short-subunit alcohol dehydrogenase family)
MAVAILDTNEATMGTAADAISSAGATGVLTIRCDVSSWEACVAAADEIDARFENRRVTFLFNNAGIASGGADYSGTVLNGTQNDSGWRKVMDVNLFGAVNILRVFVPRFVDAGPLSSGKAVRVVTTSSVMGLYDGAMGLSPYNCSKMACTAVCEMVYNELKSAGEVAAHVQTHSLHPSMAGTGLFGSPELSKLVETGVEGVAGGLSASNVIDSLFAQIASGRFYCIVDDAKDVPAVEQIARRMQGQINGVPTEATPMAMLGAFMSTRQVEKEPAPARANL